jgi:hypothetical protein
MTEEFSYTLEDEQIPEYLKLPTEDKLKWLEEIQEFNNLVTRSCLPGLDSGRLFCS